MDIDTMLLAEAGLEDICKELNKRNINFIFVANYYESKKTNKAPVISYSVRDQDLTHGIGLLKIAENQLVAEFNDSIQTSEDFFDNNDKT